MSAESINLGLEPEEAVAMGLAIEDLEAGERRKPTASYVPADWQDWLRHHRVGLHAMTTPRFIAWRDAKMAAFGRPVPPAAVLTNDRSGALEHRLHRRSAEQILRETGIEERVAAALQEIAPPLPENLLAAVDRALADQPAASWRAAVASRADQLLATQRWDRPPQEGGP